MKYITINDNEYVMNLNTKAMVEAEDRMNKSLFLYIHPMLKEPMELPLLKDSLIIFHQALVQYQHGISLDDVYDLYDKYLKEGHTYSNFVEQIVELLRDSGMLPNSDEEAEEEDSKN